MNWLRAVADFFGAERYSQHAICLTNDQAMIVLYTLSEIMTSWSYFFIGFSLLKTYRWGVELSPSVKLLFGMFIFLCGSQHFTSVLTIYSGVYRLDILFKVATSAVSVVTAATTFLTFLKGPPDAYARTRR